MATILLSTLNARYIHSSLGLRYLYANMAELQGQTILREFTTAQRPLDIAEAILAEQPRIVGLAVYIWNVRETEELVALLRTLQPGLCIVLGGPEVSYEWERQTIVSMADYLICGQGDLAFAELCRQILHVQPPTERIIHAPLPAPDRLCLPYVAYSDEDIRQRVVYVEASRGCPFKCEFCLSALDRSAVPFALERLLPELERLYQRGLRHFKFVDRSFNLKIEHCQAILEFFLQHLDDGLFLHFELVPDRLPEALKASIARFPAGSLQFEIGIQSLNPEVQARISRKQDAAKTEANLKWLREHSHAHLHADLIIGLPGEDMQSFAEGFNRLLAMRPHEIQLGLLKRLRGTPIIRHTDEFGMRFSPYPPYTILATDAIPFKQMQALARFARYWDLIANSGRFTQTLPLILGNDPFTRFMQLSDWIYTQTGQTHRIHMPRLFALIYQALSEGFQLDPTPLEQVLREDYQQTGHKGALTLGTAPTRSDKTGMADPDRRQQRHRNTSA
jgi:radical SAM superfamily enzyme YgiQ (UPF0313 family)